jgi:hypothetical protein
LIALAHLVAMHLASRGATAAAGSHGLAAASVPPVVMVSPASAAVTRSVAAAITINGTIAAVAAVPSQRLRFAAEKGQAQHSEKYNDGKKQRSIHDGSPLALSMEKHRFV